MVLQTTPSVELGERAYDFRLLGTDGKWYSLADIRGDAGTLIMFLCNHCPYVRGVVDRIVRDVGELLGYGIKGVGIMSNDTIAYPEDSFENMGRFALRHGFCFPYVLDETQEVARAYKAVCTPDFFGYDRDLRLQYRGRLDASRMDSQSDVRRELFEAMVEVARTGRVSTRQYPSMGCSIKWRT